MKVVAINGSPRRTGNSAQMLKAFEAGVLSVVPDAEVEYVDLYTMKFTGCTSCFSCKRKGGEFYGRCPIKDGIHDLIEHAYEADALAIATPIYFGDMNAQTKCFLERALFSRTTYRINHDSVAKKPVPVTMIYTMNCPKELASEIGYTDTWDITERYIGNAFKHPVTRVCAYNTYQFRNYEDYEMEMFREEDKRSYRDENFDADLRAAYDAGVAAARRIEN